MEGMNGKTGTKPLHIVAVVLAYWVISISMVFANKYLVGSANSAEDLSLFVAWLQCVFTVIFVWIMNSVQRAIHHWQQVEVNPLLATSMSSRLEIMRKISPMTCTYVGMLTFNNLCLKHVGVAFFQVARSMTLIFTVVLSILILKKKMSLKVFGCCMAVASGFVLGIDQEKLAGTLSVQGVVYGVITSMFVALNGIFTKRCLDVVDRDSVRLTLYNNINASALFVPFVLFSGQFSWFGRLAGNDIYFLLCLAATGCLSFAIAWISALQIDLTSPVTHHISANSKAVLQTLIAVIYYHQMKQPLWWFSILLVVSGATAYAIVRLQEDSAATKQLPDTPHDVESGVHKGSVKT